MAERKETYEEFRKRILKIGTGHKKVFKITHSYGVYDCYKFVRKNKWYNIGRPVTEEEFYAIVRMMNLLLGQYLIEGHKIKLPMRMGALEPRNKELGVFEKKNGKLAITYTIDWESTFRLWYEDDEAYQQRSLVRFNNKEGVYMQYKKYPANFCNKMFYKFNLNRTLARTMVKNKVNGLLDNIW